ncbi:MAG: DUF456 domain-containing protein [Cyanobacteria bacterium J06648_10]
MSPFSLLYIVLIILMLVGIAGALLPALPGNGLILAAVLVWTFASPAPPNTVAITTAVLAFVLSFGVSYLTTYLGAKKVGASQWGQVGAVVGLIVGFLGLLPALPIGGPLIGILAGTMLGAFIGEFLYRKELSTGERFRFSSKVSLAVVVSSLLGTLLEGVFAITAVIIFVWTTWAQSGLIIQ